VQGRPQWSTLDDGDHKVFRRISNIDVRIYIYMQNYIYRITYIYTYTLYVYMIISIVIFLYDYICIYIYIYKYYTFFFGMGSRWPLGARVGEEKNSGAMTYHRKTIGKCW